MYYNIILSDLKFKGYKMKKMILVFSHVLTPTQRADGERILEVGEFVELPKELKEIWGNIDPTFDEHQVKEQLNPVFDFIAENATRGDYVLVQGDFGATYKVITFCKDLTLRPVYATTKRDFKEIQLPNGDIEKRAIFSHIRFREYI